jgi:hypothetical protein
MLVTTNCAILLIVAVGFRIWRLDHVPGLNGDEAWMGVQAVEFLRGGPVAWRTPTNNPLNIFFFVPQVVVHLLAEPSIETLRWPAVLSGLAALLVNYVCCRRLFDARTATVATLLLAVLPVNIVYSRFAWDACQSLLATLLVVYPALATVRDPAHRARWLMLSGLALAGALVVHPTNIFVAPFWAVAAIVAWRDDGLTGWRRIGQSGWRLPMTVAAACVVIVVLLVGRHWVQTVAWRLATPKDWWHFFRHFPRLFSGVTVYQFIAGSTNSGSPAARWHDAVTGLAGLAIFVAAWRMVRPATARLDRCLLAGWLLTMAGFFLVAGPMAIAPHSERYAICLIGPTALLIARAAIWWLARPGWVGRAATVAGLLLAWLMLAAFYLQYFDTMDRTGGESHRAFRTANVEPKLAALRQIRAVSPPGEPIAIIADEWWTYWPLRYLAARDSDIRVVEVEADAPSGSHVWRIEFVEPNVVIDREAHSIEDALGRPVLRLTRFRSTAK